MGLYQGFAGASPPTTAVNDGGGGMAAGVEFFTTSACWVTGLRWWWVPGCGTATRTLNIYRCDGGDTGARLLATDLVSAPSGSSPRWYDVPLAAPLQVTAGQHYRAVLHHPQNRYVSTFSGWGAARVNGPLVMPTAADAVRGRQGSYAYASTMAYPWLEWGQQNYWIDVIVSDTDPNGRPVYAGPASLSAVGSLATSLVKGHADTRATSGQGSLAADSTPRFVRSAAMTGVSASDGMVHAHHDGVAVGGRARLTARGFDPASPSRPPVFRIIDGALSPTAWQFAGERPDGGLRGSGRLLARGVYGGIGHAALSGAGSSGVSRNLPGAAALAAAGAASAAASLSVSGGATGTASGGLTAGGAFPTPGASAVSGAGTLGAAASVGTSSGGLCSAGGSLAAVGVAAGTPPVVASSSTALGSSSTVTVAAPSGIAPGDVLVAVQYIDPDGSAAALTGASGWTPTSPAGSSNAGYGRVFTRTAGSAEPSSYVFGGSANASTQVTILRVQGAGAVSTATWSITPGTAGTSHQAPSVDGASGSLLVNAWFYAPGAAASWSLPGGAVAASPTSTPGPWISGVVAHRALASASATGTQTATSSIPGHAPVGGLCLSLTVLGVSGGGGGETPVGALFSDTFSGADGAALDAAKWALGITGTGASATIRGGRARFVTGTAGGYAGSARISRRVVGVTAADLDISGTYTPQGESYPAVFFRAPDTLFDTGGGYGITLPAPGGDANLRLVRHVSYSGVSLASQAYSAASGTEYGFRAQIIGSTLRAKIWVASTAEPAAWNLTATDSTITGTGHIGVGVGAGNSPGTYVEFGEITIAAPSVRYTGATRPWAADSPWNTPTPAGATWFDTPVLHTQPGTGVPMMWWIGRAVNVFCGALTDPLWTLTLPADSGWAAANRRAKAAKTVQVHAPPNVAIAQQDGGDGVIVLVDGTHYYETWLSVVDTQARTITATVWWEGDIVTGSGVGEGDTPAGVRAANMSWAGGAITGRDLARGEIDHALALLLPDGLLNAVGPIPPWRPPATFADNGGHVGPIMCGSKIGIPAGVPKPPGLTPIGSMIFGALQTYGAYVGDYVGGGWPFFTAEESTTTDSQLSPFYDPWNHGGFADYMLIEPLLRVEGYQP